MKRKILAITLGAALFAAAMLSGCANIQRGVETEPEDTSKTQLYVGCWDGGFRTNWLDELADGFEEEFADVSLEDGKTGVQVWVNPSKNYAHDSVATSILGVEDDIVICEQANYYAFVQNNSALEITDIVTDILDEYGETRSIEGKMSQNDREFYGVLQEDGSRKYYALPWYASFFGINYDIDLFEDCNYYFAAEGTGYNGFVTSLTDRRSNGPDGVPCEVCAANGYNYSEHLNCDDGLPATYEEFFALCDKIASDGLIPIIWTGAVRSYMNSFTSSLANDAEGYAQASLNYTLDGTQATTLIRSIGSDGTLEFMDPVGIDNTNGYLMQKQAGKYYALQFMDTLVNTRDSLTGQTKYYNEQDGFSSTNSHTVAQAKFLNSKYSDDSATIAMIAEGSWWYNEATPTFNALSSIPGAGQLERRIGFMPMPKPNETYLGEACYTNTWITDIVIRANIDESKIRAAKEFIRYIHTDESLSLFTRYANGVRLFDYQLTAEDEPNTSYFAKLALEIYRTEQIVNPWSSNPLVYNNLSSFVGNFTSEVGTGNDTDLYTVVITGLRGGTVTGRQYFEGLSNYMDEDMWNSTFRNYISG